MLFSKVTSREIRFMIGLVFTIGNIFLSQQNNGVDLNNMSLGIHPPLFLLQESLDLLEHYLSLNFLKIIFRLRY